MDKLSLNQLCEIYCENDWGLCNPIPEQRKGWIHVGLYHVLLKLASHGLLRMIDLDCGDSLEKCMLMRKPKIKPDDFEEWCD